MFGSSPINYTDPTGLRGAPPTSVIRHQTQRAQESLAANFVREMNPFSQGTSANDQFAAGWAMLMGDYQTAGDLSGIGQIQDAGASKGWEYAYWSAVIISGAADTCAAGGIVTGVNPWLGKVAIHGAHAGGPHQYPHLQIMIRVGQHVTKHFRIPLP